MPACPTPVLRFPPIFHSMRSGWDGFQEIVHGSGQFQIGKDVGYCRVFETHRNSNQLGASRRLDSILLWLIVCLNILLRSRMPFPHEARRDIRVEW